MPVERKPYLRVRYRPGPGTGTGDHRLIGSGMPRYSLFGPKVVRNPNQTVLWETAVWWAVHPRGGARCRDARGAS